MADVNAKFDQIVRDYWNFRLASEPVRATKLREMPGAEVRNVGPGDLRGR